jgi:hypothetical protein
MAASLREDSRMQRLMQATIVVLLIGTLFLYPLLAPPPHRIDESHFQLVTEGMTEAEVEAIFGVAAGSYDWACPKTEYFLTEVDVARPTGNQIADVVEDSLAGAVAEAGLPQTGQGRCVKLRLR